MTYGKFKDDEPKNHDRKDDEREKPSWRELDAKRDRSKHLSDSPAPDRPKKFEDKRAQSQAKAAFSELFKPKASKERETAWTRVGAAKGSDFSKEATTFVEKFGPPTEWDRLLKLLDHSDAKFLEVILDKLEDLLPNETDMRRELLRGKLRVLKLERDEPELLEKFEEVLHALASGANDIDYA